MAMWEYTDMSSDDPEFYEFEAEGVRDYMRKEAHSYAEDGEPPSDWATIVLAEETTGQLLVDWEAISKYLQNAFPNPYYCTSCCTMYEDSDDLVEQQYTETQLRYFCCKECLEYTKCDHCNKLFDGEHYPSGGHDKICKTCNLHYSRPREPNESQIDYEGRLPY